jgi:hypothetical protein
VNSNVDPRESLVEDESGAIHTRYDPPMPDEPRPEKLDYAGPEVRRLPRPPLRFPLRLALTAALVIIGFIGAFVWWRLRWSIFGP